MTALLIYGLPVLITGLLLYYAVRTTTRDYLAWQRERDLLLAERTDRP